MSLSSMAQEIWEALGKNERSNAATTIAVIQAPDKQLFCTSNDVNVSMDAIKIAKQYKIYPIGKDYISSAGAGFHAEMWAVIQALTVNDKVSNVISKIGASRPCCKYCTEVLKYLKVNIEQPSDTEYQSWYNPITMGQEGGPRDNIFSLQKKAIPDFRNRNLNYWFYSIDGKKFLQKPPDNAK